MAPLNDFVDLENWQDDEQEEEEDDVSSMKDEGGLPRFLGLGMRAPTAQSARSARSNASKRSIIAKPIRLVRRLTNASQGADGRDQPHISDGKNLILFLRANQLGSGSVQKSCDWYVTFLNLKCKTLWSKIRPVLAGAKEGGATPDEDDLAKVDRVLTTIARVLSNKKEIALVDVVDEVVNTGLILDVTDDRVILHQLMFTFLGWLTMLYEPKETQKAMKLQLAKKATNSWGHKINLTSRTIYTYNQSLEYIDHPLSLLLGHFGKLIPDPPSRRASSFAPANEYIAAAFVCYQTLRKVCHIEIEWVSAINQHLEFDSARRVLKLFRYPSFCHLMVRHYGPKSSRGLLSQLFDDNERNITGESRAESDRTSSFFKEMLLSYRLVFGQDSSSHSLFAAEMHLASKSRKPSLFALPDADPLLKLLCTYSADSPEAAEVYESLHAENPQAYYMPAAFPWLGERLLAVQGYVKEQHPHNWKTLWHDHRNKSNWWQFWAVLFIGGTTIILSVFSLAFQIWQAVLTQQQLIQGQQNLQPGPKLVGDI